jgi:Uncharacterized protein conserved in bacteria (DUF2066)
MTYDDCRAALRGMLAIFAALVALGGGAARAAPAADAFTIKDVAVDATAAAATTAREQAIAEGQRRAFDRLIARLVPKESRDAVPRLDSRDITELVRDFEVNSEKVSDVRYLAHLQIRFKPDAVRALLRTASVPFAESMSRSLVVLPVLRSAAALRLWDDPNPWRAAWAQAPPTDGLVPLIEPKGDNADINDIGPEQAIARDPDRIAAIAGRYGAAGALVVYASRREVAQGGRPVLDVTAVRSDAANDQTLVQSFVAADGESDDAFYARVQEVVETAIEDSWKRANLLRFDSPRGIEVSVPLKDLADWVAIRRRIAAISFVRASGVRSLSRENAVLSLQYFGDEDQLAGALAQRGLALEEGATGWTLRLSDSAGATPPR